MANTAHRRTSDTPETLFESNDAPPLPQSLPPLALAMWHIKMINDEELAVDYPNCAIPEGTPDVTDGIAMLIKICNESPSKEQITAKAALCYMFDTFTNLYHYEYFIPETEWNNVRRSQMLADYSADIALYKQDPIVLKELIEFHAGEHPFFLNIRILHDYPRLFGYCDLFLNQSPTQELHFFAEFARTYALVIGKFSEHTKDTSFSKEFRAESHSLLNQCRQQLRDLLELTRTSQTIPLSAAVTALFVLWQSLPETVRQPYHNEFECFFYHEETTILGELFNFSASSMEQILNHVNTSLQSPAPRLMSAFAGMLSEYKKQQPHYATRRPSPEYCSFMPSSPTLSPRYSPIKCESAKTQPKDEHILMAAF